MADSDEILKKTDALLGRYRGASRGDRQDDFPVLTEVVDTDPGAGREIDVTEQLKAPLDARLDARLDKLVAAHLADALHERLESRLQAAMDEIRSELRALIDTSVAAALARALADIEQPRNSDTDSP